MSRTLLLAVLIALPACATNRPASTRPAPTSAASAENPYFVCHKGKWKRVAVPAIDAHRRHGDRVVTTVQRENTGCQR